MFCREFHVSQLTSQSSFDISWYETEVMAGKVYGEILEVLKSHNDDELYDSIESIYFAELRSVEEVRMLLN